MIPYLLCLLLPILFFLFNKKKPKHLFFVFLVLLSPFFLLIALKGESVGSDTISYNQMFTMMKEGTFDQEASFGEIEVGYKTFLFLLTN